MTILFNAIHDQAARFASFKEIELSEKERVAFERQGGHQMVRLFAHDRDLTALLVYVEHWEDGVSVMLEFPITGVLADADVKEAAWDLLTISAGLSPQWSLGLSTEGRLTLSSVIALDELDVEEATTAFTARMAVAAEAVRDMRLVAEDLGLKASVADDEAFKDLAASGVENTHLANRRMAMMGGAQESRRMAMMDNRRMAMMEPEVHANRRMAMMDNRRMAMMEAEVHANRRMAIAGGVLDSRRMAVLGERALDNRRMAMMGDVLANRRMAMMGEAFDSRRMAMAGGAMDNRRMAMMGEALANRRMAMMGEALASRRMAMIDTPVANRRMAMMADVLASRRMAVVEGQAANRRMAMMEPEVHANRRMAMMSDMLANRRMAMASDDDSER